MRYNKAINRRAKMKLFDLYEDSYMEFRIAQNVTEDWIAEYCKQHGREVTRNHQRSANYFDAFVKVA